MNVHRTNVITMMTSQVPALMVNFGKGLTFKMIDYNTTQDGRRHGFTPAVPPLRCFAYNQAGDAGRGNCRVTVQNLDTGHASQAHKTLFLDHRAQVDGIVDVNTIQPHARPGDASGKGDGAVPIHERFRHPYVIAVASRGRVCGRVRARQVGKVVGWEWGELAAGLVFLHNTCICFDRFRLSLIFLSQLENGIGQGLQLLTTGDRGLRILRDRLALFVG